MEEAGKRDAFRSDRAQAERNDEEQLEPRVPVRAFATGGHENREICRRRIERENHGEAELAAEATVERTQRQ